MNSSLTSIGRLVATGGLLCGFSVALTACARAVTVKVTNTGDFGTGSLRAALLFANAHPGTQIEWAVPSGALRGGVALIRPATPLPTLMADGTRIDGTSQTRFGGNTNPGGPEIMLDGGRLDADTPGLGAHDNFIGGTNPGARNILSGNGFNGANLSFDSYGNSVQGNLIGLALDGHAVPNAQEGVLLSERSHDNVIGGTQEGARNIISGNGAAGIYLSGGTARNRIQGNFLGTTISGDAPLYNKNYALLLSGGAHDNLIGGPQKGARNILVGNYPIVFFTDKGTTGNRVQGNNIGVDATGTHVLLEGWASVQFSDGATANSLGGSDQDAGNLIGVTTATKDQYIGNSSEGNLIQNNTPWSEADNKTNAPPN